MFIIDDSINAWPFKNGRQLCITTLTNPLNLIRNKMGEISFQRNIIRNIIC